MPSHPTIEITKQRAECAAVIATQVVFQLPLRMGILPMRLGLTLSEALVLGLLRQDVKVFFVVFGHGSTEVGEVLRIYQQAGLLRVFGVRNEIEASHAATALGWVREKKQL